ncbi:MAG: pimelyl-ACP methyl ester esterase [Deltaproteobacteria bacterium HGW-Deltaproteobacteria-4]|nr:MAG: pimelyl-ACP methyl ester esterase [Deltaproteobacteria bacterium HGW-Deltaproteobacteria-4]
MNSLLLPDGRTFAWRSSGSGAPLVFIHGWGSSAAIFDELMSRLPDCHCLAPDLPGYGASTASATIDLAALAEDLLHWFDALKLETVTLLGWSLGGMIAQELAARFPQHIKRLILLATTPCFVATPDWPHGLTDTSVRALARDFKRAPTPTLANFWSLQFQGECPPPSPLLVDVETATALGGLELLRRIDLRSHLSAITLPALVLHGSADVIIPIGAGRFLSAALPQAHFHEFSGCGHAPFYRAAAPVSALIRDFLS